ncbi:MAG: hypothetical protein AMXMBFR47_02100 [Planctomycetota bacterium]
MVNGFGPQYSLYSDDGHVWQYQGGALRAQRSEAPSRAGQVLDFRSFGLSSGIPNRSPSETLGQKSAGAPAPRKYSIAAELGNTVVRGVGATDTVVWWLDPAAGNTPTRVVREVSGNIIEEARYSLKNYDGEWFPERAEFFSTDYKSGKEPRQIVEIHSIYINQPDQPTAITPEVIGIDAGVFVEGRNAHGQVVESGFWDGTKIVSSDEYDKRIKSGDWTNGPNFERNSDRYKRTGLAGGEQPGAETGTNNRSVDGQKSGRDRSRGTIDRYQSEWELYTQRFIQKYRLDEEQRQKAISILDQCQGLAREYCAKNSAKLNELSVLLLETAKTDDASHKRVSERMAELLRPIEDIFSDRLKPGLDKLPTRAQRRAAEEFHQNRNGPSPVDRRPSDRTRP